MRAVSDVRHCHAKCGRSTAEQPLPTSWGAVEVRLPEQPLPAHFNGHCTLVFCSSECGAQVLRELASVLSPNPIRDFLEGRPVR